VAFLLSAGLLSTLALAALAPSGRYAVQVLAAGLLGARLSEGGTGVLQRRSNDCGPAALAHCLHRLGDPVPYPDPRSGLSLDEGGCEIGELAQEARRLGWEARAIHARSLDAIEPPAILHFRYGHYVVYDGRERCGRVVIHDPSLGQLSYPERALEAQWTGHALVFEGRARTPEGAG
jgi:ABC-type bacteriocin/lantibiotic exporter with double-glycine peptidase domain